MPDLPQKKVGIIACSGEEMAEGTVTRLAALKVLEELRPDDTVTICLPLFLAGGEGDRAFARFYPTIAIDGCDLRCAARATEQYSGKPAASVVVTELVAELELDQPAGLRRLNDAGRQAVTATAQQVAELVDTVLERKWSRREGGFLDSAIPLEVTNPMQPAATCACGSGIPTQAVEVDGRPVVLAALPLLLAQFSEAGRAPGPETTAALLEQVALYNPVLPAEQPAYAAALDKAYAAYCRDAEVER